MQTLEELFNYDRALVFGIGGGGDIVGSVPTARLLELHGVDVILGGIAFDRLPVDPMPGPRNLDHFEGIERISQSVALLTSETEFIDGASSTEMIVNQYTDRSVALLDVTGGVSGFKTGLETACSELDIDLVVGVDAGGDVLATGDEPGLRSPLCDSIVLSSVNACNCPAAIGVFGYGSDGELTQDELDDAISRAARRSGLLGSWGLTPATINELENLLDLVTTEASRLPVKAASGQLGTCSIRSDRRTLELSAASTTTFYFEPGAIESTSEPATVVAGTDSHLTANRMLNEAGYVTELDRELEQAEEQVTSDD